MAIDNETPQSENLRENEDAGEETKHESQIQAPEPAKIEPTMPQPMELASGEKVYSEPSLLDKELHENIQQPNEEEESVAASEESDEKAPTAPEGEEPAKSAAPEFVPETPGDASAELSEMEAAKQERSEPERPSRQQRVEEDPALIERRKEAFEELKLAQQKSSTIFVHVASRIKGGLRVTYKDLPLFLPTSHFSNRRNPSEEELAAIIGTELETTIQEIQEDASGRPTVIVTRRKILERDFWDSIKVGDEVEGVVSSIATFGVFLDLGGVEGLIHISRLAPYRVDDPSKRVKKGQTLKAKVVEVDKSKRRIALSRRDYEPSPWQGISEKFPAGSRVNGVVRRITDFGAYVEVAPGIEGLVHNSELSWARRVKNPAEVVSLGQEIELEVLKIEERKQHMSLSLKKTQENPWIQFKEKYAPGAVAKGIINQIIPQGAVITVNDEVDGFMPRSKMRDMQKGEGSGYNVGDEIEVEVTDLVVEQESLILKPAGGEDPAPRRSEGREGREHREGFGERRGRPSGSRGEEVPKELSPSGSVTFQDLLSDKAKKTLFGGEKPENK
ncbi:MAG: S1 RNA-binding domain-containing protein [Chloroflexota bacterium]